MLSSSRPLVLWVHGMLGNVNLISAERGGARKGVDELRFKTEKQCQSGADG